MKKLTFLMAALLVAMTGCQKEPQVSDETQDGAEVYMSFSVEAVTKSATDDTGDSNSDATPETEVGKDVENKISNVQVYLHPATGDAIKATDVNLVGGGVNYTATFKEEEIQTGVEYSIYVICNESVDINPLDPETIVKTVSGTDGRELNISADNSFLMTNAKQALKKTITADELNSCMSPTTPLNLGTVEVERTVARFDYANKEADNLYEIAGNTVQIYLSEAAVINISKASYYFRRVAADKTGTPFVVGGTETPVNYVVDTDWAKKTALKGTWATDDAADLFSYPLEDKTSWKWIDITNLTDADKVDGAINGNQYNFLSYVSENTLPGTEAQINGLSTGVVFRGYLHDGSAKLNGSEKLYVYANKYYGNWAAVESAATPGTDAALTGAYEAVKADPTDLAACAKAGFTVYTPDVSGNYPVYYYYWNRHNDNDKPFDMGTMEFSVVRNNVYKLAVTKISNFGHPENPDGDPDPVKPENDDEQVRHYFQVSVKILPWTVRVNDIEF